MNYLIIPSSNAVVANQWIVDNLDPNGFNTFVINRQDVNGNQCCLISLPNNGSDFVEGMKTQFGYMNRHGIDLMNLTDVLTNDNIP